MSTQSLRDIRKARGLSQAQVADAARTTRVYITQIENGQRTPSPKVLKALADVLGLTMDEAFEIIGGSLRTAHAAPGPRVPPTAERKRGGRA